MACRDYEAAGARKRNPALKWWADPKERVLGLILLDNYNNDWFLVVLGPDENGDF